MTVIRAPRDDNTTLRQTPAPARSADLKSQPQGRPDDQQIEQLQGVFLRASRTSAEVSYLTTLPPPGPRRARARVAGRAGNGKKHQGQANRAGHRQRHSYH